MKKKYYEVELEVIQLNFCGDVLTASVDGTQLDNDNLIPIDEGELGW